MIKEFLSSSGLDDDKAKAVAEYHLHRIEGNPVDDLYQLFGDHISRTQFFYLKRLFSQWFGFCGDNDTARRIKAYGYNEYSAEEESEIFENVAEMDGRILDEYEKLTQTRNGLYRLRTICILTWYGLSVDQIVNLKKSDIDFEIKTICVERNGKPCTINVDEYGMDVISEYARSVLTVNYDTYNEYRVRDSEYLLRGTSGRYNVKSIPADFNKFIEKTKGNLHLNRKMIAVNGTVCEAYKREINGLNTITALKSEVLFRGMNETNYQSFLPYYLKWKEKYASN